MNKLLLWLALPPALLLFLFSLAVAGVIVSALPPLVVWVSVALVLVIGAWIFFGRRGASKNLAGSESSLMGRQSSKEGLL